MKLAKLLSIVLLFGMLGGVCGCAAPAREPETPELETLAGVVLARTGGMVYGQDFQISVVPGRIEWMYVFLPDCTPVSGGPVSISDSQWEAIEAAVLAAQPEEIVPNEPSFFDKLREKFTDHVEVLDGGSEISLKLTWESKSGTRTADYVWQGDLDLWNVLYDLAQSKAAELPLEED